MSLSSIKIQKFTDSFYCAKCGFTGNIPENEPIICPNCNQPLEDRLQIKLSGLSSQYFGHRIIFKGVIRGEGVKKALPVKIKAECEICDFTVEINLLSKDYEGLLKDLLFVKKRGIEKHLWRALPRGPCRTKVGHKWNFEFEEWLDYRFIKVSGLIMEEEEQKRGATTRAYTGILLGEMRDIKNCLFDAEPILAPDSTICLLIYEAVPLETIAESLKPEEKKEIRSVFGGKSLDELSTLLNRVVELNVKGRVEAKIAAVLTALSPKWLKVKNSGFVPGCIRTLFFGAPRTGKGMILRWFWRKGLAGHAVAETASRTGLVYNIDPDLRILSWGILPQNDGRMVVIEGLQGLESEEVSRFREVLAQQRVEVHRFVEGSAWCRTRILADCNPNKPALSHYLFKCKALRDIKSLYDPIDLTRFDLFIPFGESDVSIDEMYEAWDDPNERVEKTFKLLVKWAWSRRAENIKFTDEALILAKRKFMEIYEKYSTSTIPIVHNAGFWTLLRLATAIATLEFNTEDGENLTVEAKHINEAAEFWEERLNDLELDIYKAFIGEEALSDKEYGKISEVLREKENLERMLFEVVKAPGDSSELAGRLDTTDVSVRRWASELKKLGILQRGRRGYNLTMKGTLFLKKWIEEKGGCVTNVTNVTEDFRKNIFFYNIQSENSVTNVTQFKFSEHVACEKCGKMGSYALVRVGGVHHLCDSCLKDWEGDL